jgi:hypothetical protein
MAAPAVSSPPSVLLTVRMGSSLLLRLAPSLPPSQPAALRGTDRSEACGVPGMCAGREGGGGCL